MPVAEPVNHGEKKLAVVLRDEVCVAVQLLARTRATPRADASRVGARQRGRVVRGRAVGPLAAEYGRAVVRAARVRKSPRRPLRRGEGVELVEQTTHRAEARAETPSGRDAVAQ